MIANIILFFIIVHLIIWSLNYYCKIFIFSQTAQSNALLYLFCLYQSKFLNQFLRQVVVKHWLSAAAFQRLRIMICLIAKKAGKTWSVLRHITSEIKILIGRGYEGSGGWLVNDKAKKQVNERCEN